jgi:hypothetical protein
VCFSCCGGIVWPQATVCVAAGIDQSIGLSATAKYVRRTANVAAGNGLGTTIKYL